MTGKKSLIKKSPTDELPFFLLQFVGMSAPSVTTPIDLEG